VNIQLIPKKEILRDFFFCYSSETDLSALTGSVRSSGVCDPLWVVSGKEGYRILAGFRRFRAAEAAGVGVLPCRVFPESDAADRLFEEALRVQASQREFHPVEKARVIQILNRLGVSGEDILTRFLPILGLAQKNELIGETAGLTSLHPALLDYLERHPVSLKQASAFRRFSAEDQAVLAGLGTGLQIRIVELSEIAAWIHDLVRVRGTSADALLAAAGLTDLIADPGLNRNEKIAAVKEALRRERYPALESWNEKIRILRDGLRMPENIRLTWDPSLESPGFRMEIRVQSAADLEAVAAFFSSKENRQRMDEILSLV
jgi:ParB-like chromosome segregation protein Spo0J